MIIQQHFVSAPLGRTRKQVSRYENTDSTRFFQRNDDLFRGLPHGQGRDKGSSSLWIVSVKGTDSFGCVRNGMKICVFGDTAVIEISQSAGLQANRLDIMNATTYGVGALVRAALDEGCRRLIFCLGGSGTNDMGAGAACAMGVKFYDRNG